MNRRAAGTVFCAIAAFLYGCRYVATAILMSNSAEWSKEIVNQFLSYIGSPLLIASIISLIVGAIYLYMGELESRRNEE